MKHLTAILAILILVLNFVPCSDSFGCLDHCVNSELDMHDHGQSEDGEDSSENELCSPFCHCQCCHTPVITLLVPQIADPLKDHSKANSNYLSTRGILSLNSIFEPPQKA